MEDPFSPEKYDNSESVKELIEQITIQGKTDVYPYFEKWLTNPNWIEGNRDDYDFLYLFIEEYVIKFKTDIDADDFYEMVESYKIPESLNDYHKKKLKNISLMVHFVSEYLCYHRKNP